METKLFFRMLLRSWWIVVLTMLSAVFAALITAYFTTPIYRASARFIVLPNPTFLGGESDVIYSLDTLDKRTVITTYAEILNSPTIYQGMFDQLGLQGVSMADYTYNAVVLPETNIVELSMQGPDPEMVAFLTNSLGQKVVEYVVNLYKVYDMNLLDAATVPVIPVTPQPLRDAAVALVVGAALGVAIALTRELLRAPIVNFIKQRNIDEMSMALNRSAFQEKLDDAAFASANDFSLAIVYLKGMEDYFHVLPPTTLEVIYRKANEVLKNQLRGNDLVGRWSDLEFIVLLSETPGTAALNTMLRVRSALSTPIHIESIGETLTLDPEIGIAEYRVTDTADSLLKNTNWALEIAKKTDGMYLLRATEPI
jgi:diguanylate cyclase (GGDEF)-like protein